MVGITIYGVVGTVVANYYGNVFGIKPKTTPAGRLGGFVGYCIITAIWPIALHKILQKRNK